MNSGIFCRRAKSCTYHINRGVGLQPARRGQRNRAVQPGRARFNVRRALPRKAAELTFAAQREPRTEENPSEKSFAQNMFDSAWRGPLLWDTPLERLGAENIQHSGKHVRSRSEFS